MPTHPAARMAARIRPRHVVVGRIVWEIREPTTAGLVANGFTAIPGLGEARKAMDEADLEHQALYDAFDNGGAVDTEKRKKDALAKQLKKQLKRIEELKTDPKKQVAFGAMMHAYVAAGVQRFGVLRADLPVLDPATPAKAKKRGKKKAKKRKAKPVAPTAWWLGKDHRELMPDGWDPTPFLEGPPIVTTVLASEPVPGPDETVTDAAIRLADRGELWVGIMDATEVSVLFQCIRGIAGGRARRADGFRWAARPVAHSLPDGQGVRVQGKRPDPPVGG